VRCRKWGYVSSRFGFRICGNESTLFDFSISPGTRSSATAKTAGDAVNNVINLPADFDVTADHLVRVEVNGTRIKTTVDGRANFVETRLPSHANSLSVFSENAKAEFTALTITDGFEDLFDSGEFDITADGWNVSGSHAAAPQQLDGELELSSDSVAIITHEQVFGDGEFAANIRLGESRDSDAAAYVSIKVDKAVLIIRGSEGSSPTFALPDLVPETYHQLRLVKIHGRLTAALDDVVLGDIECDLPVTKVSVFCSNASAFIEMVRATSI
jgi:hypothetical protein